MSNELMKKDNELMEVGGMNPLQGMFQQMLVPQTKRISPNAGMITRKFHKWGQKDFAEIAKYESEALEYQAKSFNLMMDVFERVATFSDRIKLQYIEMEHKKNMMSLMEKKEQAIIMGIMLDNEIKQGTLKRMGLEDEIMRSKTDLENELMQAKIKQVNIDNKLGDLEFQIKAKEMEAIINGR